MSKNVRSRRLVAAAALFGVVASMGLAAAPAHAAVTHPDGLYHASTPKRLLDTRSVGGSVAVGGKVTVPRSAFTAAGLPSSGVQSVVVNLTVTAPTGPGYAVAYSGSVAPGTSNINFAKGWTGASRATVALTSSGLTVQIGGMAGTRTQVIVDLEGWYGNASDPVAGGGSLLSGSPFRFGDTRQAGVGPLAAGKTADWPLRLSDSDESLPFNPTAVLVNLTATGSTGAGNLTAWSGAGAKPGTSTVNFAQGETSPNTAIIPVRKVGSDYHFAISNTGPSSTNYVIDLLGIFGASPDGSALFAKHVMLSPVRVMNFVTIGPKGTAQANVAKYVDLNNTLAVEGNLTAANPTAASYQTAYVGSTRPDVSALNVVPGTTRANGVLFAGDDVTPQIAKVYNNAGTIKAIVDLTGRFDWADQTVSNGLKQPLLRPGLRTPVGH